MYPEITSRTWGLTMARSWARLLLDRLGEYVGQGRRGRSGESPLFHDEDDEAQETNNYHNPAGGSRAFSHGAGQSEGS